MVRAHRQQASVSGETAVSSGDIRIALITDTHIRAGVDGDPSSPGAMNGSRCYYASQYLFRQFRDEMNSIGPDAVIHLGDVCDSPPDWMLCSEVWESIEAPIRKIVPGNHDFCHADADELVCQ